MNKKIIILIILGLVLLITIILGIFLINKNNTQNYDMSGKKQLANSIEKNENIKIITTMANENVISPNNENDDKQEYILREKNGYIAIYRIDENGKEILIETTEIVVAYLPEVDRNELSKGIKAFGKQELNLKLEDYE